MLDWTRKYLSDIAWVAKECARDGVIASEHREHFARVHKLAKLASTAPAGGIDAAMREAVGELCMACRFAGFADSCPTRTDWQAHCPLVARRLQT